MRHQVVSGSVFLDWVEGSTVQTRRKAGKDSIKHASRHHDTDLVKRNISDVPLHNACTGGGFHLPRSTVKYKQEGRLREPCRNAAEEREAERASERGEEK